MVILGLMFSRTVSDEEKMARVPPVRYEEADPSTQAAFDQIVATQGHMTNMKATLAHSLPALDALMQWYPLREEVQEFLDARSTMLFVHAISSATDCLICSTFFRRLLIDAGENPDDLKMNDRETTVVDFGRQLVRDPNRLSDELYARLAQQFSQPQIVALTAFGAMMIATNVFNNALRIDLDEYLQPYRRVAAE
jgi:alkylhydroperoxidase family enzyme